MTPQELTYYMPAEWFPHACTYISWPVRESMLYPAFFEEVCNSYAEIVRAIAEFEPVIILINPGEEKNLKLVFEEGLFRNKRIELMAIAHNDAWLRDNGPTFVINSRGNLAGINWRFNAWGGKYPPWDLDDRVAPVLLTRLGLPCFNPSLIMEGGSIHVDGEGTLLTTEQCLLNPNRNRGMSREQIELILRQYLGTSKVIWLKDGLYGDDTDGHVDNIACFAGPGKILLQTCDDPDDDNYSISQENLKILERESDAAGRKLEIIPVQQPLRLDYNDRRLTLSYLNFYFTNGGIILPIFGGQSQITDDLAVEVLHRTFPHRKIRTFNGMAIVREGGSVHCITQQMPRGSEARL